MKHLLEKLRDMGNCMSSLWEESGLLAQTMREMQKLGTEMSELAKTALVEIDEPEKRKIDGDEFQGWYVDSAGWAVSSDGGALDSDDVKIKAKIEQLIATSPDAIRALIDFVNWSRNSGVVSAHGWTARFEKIITDAGFACDINQRSE